jgi:hypothetical protein
MKKFVVLFVAVMLALPAISFAGSATSRWDLTIGGMVKVDIGYVDQSVDQDYIVAERQAGNNNTSSRDKYGALSFGEGETRLNFLVKGPDTWGAKTSAFVEFDFRSMTSNAVAASARNSVEDYGLANLRHAFMKFDWPTFSLVIGKTWQVPGVQPCFCLLDVNELAPFNKGGLPVQVYGVWQATKQFSITAGVMAPYSENSWSGGTLASGPTIDDGMQRSLWPDVFTEIAFKTDACGKIGPWMLQFAVGGIYGKDKPLAPSTLGPVGDINTQNGANTVSNTGIAGVQYFNPGGYDTSTVDMWMLTGRVYIPIIPEKAPGKLAGSLGLALTGFTGQDIRRYAGPPPFALAALAYNRADYTTNYNTTTHPVADYVAPVATGGWGQLSFYFTDTVWASFYYGQINYALSQARRGYAFGGGPTGSGTNGAMSAGAVSREQQYVVNLVYDPNPAIRLGLEYTYTQSNYGRNLYGQTAGSLTDYGNNNSVRFAAQYFF